MSRGNPPKEASEFPRRLKIFVIIFALLISFGTLSFKFIKGISLQESLIRTLETLAFMFHEESGATRFLEVFLAIVGVFLIWWILWSIADMLIDRRLSEYLKIRKFINMLKKMRNHYVIAGGGRFGEELAKKFSEKGESYIIIEKDEKRAPILEKKGFVVFKGSALDESILRKTNVDKAKALIVALPETEKNLMVAVIAKEINNSLTIYARADDPSFVSKLKRLGVKAVVVPEVTSADKLFEEID